MTEPDPVGTQRVGRRHPWVTRAVTTVPLFAMTAGWTLVLGEQADAPSVEMITAVGAPLPVEVAVPGPVTAPVTAAPGSLNTTAERDLARSADAADIPDEALAAYQRAATVINATDRGCHLEWELLAGIGRVESDHGRFAGSVLDASGVAQPAIYGIALDGSRGTSVIDDTDQGELDGDAAYDRAVGPMQFIPSTWTYVGVDADGDGVRDPQDIDDAALAAAVYLCVGDQDLGTVAGQRNAVHRYNHSQEYVDLVLSIARAYERGDFTTVPAGDVPSLPTTTQTRPTDPVVPPVTDDPGVPAYEQVTEDPVWERDPTPVDQDHGPFDPDDPAEPDPDDPSPTDPTPTDDPSPTDPTPTDDPSPTDPTPTDDPSPTDPSPTDVPTDPGAAVTEESAAALCAEIGYLDDPAIADEPFDACVALLLDGPVDEGLPTPEVLLARLEEAGIPLPPA